MMPGRPASAAIPAMKRSPAITASRRPALERRRGSDPTQRGRRAAGLPLSSLDSAAAAGAGPEPERHRDLVAVGGRTIRPRLGHCRAIAAPEPAPTLPVVHARQRERLERESRLGRAADRVGRDGLFRMRAVRRPPVWSGTVWADAPSAPASSAFSAPDGLPAMKCHTLRSSPGRARRFCPGGGPRRVRSRRAAGAGGGDGPAHRAWPLQPRAPIMPVGTVVSPSRARRGGGGVEPRPGGMSFAGRR